MKEVPIWLALLLSLALASACLFGFFYMTEQVAEKGDYYWYASFAFITLAFLALIGAIAVFTSGQKTRTVERRQRSFKVQEDYKRDLRGRIRKGRR